MADREKILEFIKNAENPVHIRTIMERLKIPRNMRTPVKRMLRGLCKEGAITRSHNKYFAGQMSKAITGRVEIKTNFGFLITGDGDDIFLGRLAIQDLLPGDEIEVYVKHDEQDRKEAVLKRIIRRSASPVMFRVEKSGAGFMGVLPEKPSPRVRIVQPPANMKPGDVVLLKVEEKAEGLSGRVVSHINEKSDIEVYRQFVLETNCVRQAFPQEVIDEAKEAAKLQKKKGERLDLRDRVVFTIDPVDAKDFDDAVSLEKKGENFLLGVHIADVSHYVAEGTPMDGEAYARGVSVYLPGEVFPMLPPNLSDDVCSLKEGVERLTFSVMMEVSPEGAMMGYEIKESVIKSKKRLTYEEAEEIISGGATSGDGAIDSTLKTMNGLKTKLKERLTTGGMVDFALGEPKLILGKRNEVLDIIRKKSLESHRLIEFFMIYANVCAADYLVKKFKRGMFRVHAAPDQKDIFEFNNMAGAMGLNYKMKKGTNKEFQKVTEMIEDNPKRYLIQRSLLRSMKLAAYSEKNTGHFGLGLEKYTHFTSPIRRYADLVVHRLIKHGQETLLMKDSTMKYLRDAARDISEAEGRAEEAEEGIFKLLALNFLKKRVGLETEGLITKINKYGFFVELSEYPVEGFLNFDMILNDYYTYDPARQVAVGTRTKKYFRLGDPVDVVIARIDLHTRRMDLEMQN